MSLKGILLELSNYKGILENLDNYLVRIAPIGNWESMLKDYNTRKASMEYVDAIEERISKLKEELRNMDNNDIEDTMFFDYVANLIEEYRNINQVKIDKLIEEISSSLVNKNSSLELVIRKEDWNLVLDHNRIDSIFTCEQSNNEGGFFISFAKSEKIENFFINSENESFDFFYSTVLSHVSEDTVYLSKNNLANNKVDFEKYLKNIKTVHQNSEKNNELIFSEEEIEILDSICQTIVESDTKILRFGTDVSIFFENLEEPLKISAAIIYIEQQLRKACNINSLTLNKIKAMNIASVLLLLAASLSKSNTAQAIATINLVFGTAMSAADSINIARRKRQEINRYKDNLLLLKVYLFNELKLTEIVHGKKGNNVNVKLASGQTITLAQYKDITKELSLEKKNTFKMANVASLPSIKKATKITVILTTLSLVVTMAIAPAFVLVKDAIHNQIEISRQAKIPVEIDYSSMSEAEYVTHQDYRGIGNNIDALTKLGQNVGDYYLLYEYAYEVEVPVENIYTKEENGKQITKKKTEYMKETRFDFAENPNHPGRTGMMKIKYTCFRGFTLNLTSQGWIQNYIESFNFKDFTNQAKYFIPEEVIYKNVTAMFTEDEFDDYFDPDIFTNNVGFEIPKHISGNSKVLR